MPKAETSIIKELLESLEMTLYVIEHATSTHYRNEATIKAKNTIARAKEHQIK